MMSRFSEKVTDTLCDNRILFLIGEIESEKTTSLIASLLHLDSLNNDPITIYLDSYGGSIRAGFAVCDVFKHLKSPVEMICLSNALSMGAVLLASASKRFALPHARIMLHQPSIFSKRDLDLTLSEITVTKEQMQQSLDEIVDIFVKNTKCDNFDCNEGIHSEKHHQYIYSLCKGEDKFLTPSEAKEIGIIDDIL